jgi:hypothetical protein
MKPTEKKSCVPYVIGGAVLVAAGAGLAYYQHQQNQKKRDAIENFLTPKDK